MPPGGGSAWCCAGGVRGPFQQLSPRQHTSFPFRNPRLDARPRSSTAPAPRPRQLGPSGGGKTTFLDILAGRKNQGLISGTVLYGANRATPALLRRYVGYVEQRDTLVDTLTGAAGRGGGHAPGEGQGAGGGTSASGPLWSSRGWQSRGRSTRFRV